MKVLLDENLDHALRHLLGPDEVVTVAYMRWASLKIGELPRTAEDNREGGAAMNVIIEILEDRAAASRGRRKPADVDRWLRELGDQNASAPSTR